MVLVGISDKLQERPRIQSDRFLTAAARTFIDLGSTMNESRIFVKFQILFALDGKIFTYMKK
jgi:hypothetical protein